MSDKAVVIINSADRISGTPNDFYVNLKILPNINYNRVCLAAAIIPKTYYLVKTGSNSFVLQEGVLQATITIPPGNYDRNLFATVLAGLLNASSPYHYAYTVTYPNTKAQPETGLYTFGVSGNSSVQPSFILGPDAIHAQLGLQPNATYQFSSNQLVSNHVCNFSSDSCIYVHCDSCTNNFTGDDILESVYMSGYPYFSYVNYVNYNPEFNSRKMVNKGQTFHFTLTDQNNLPIDFNGIDVTLTIMMWRDHNLEALVERYIHFKVSSKNLETTDE